MRMFMEGKAWLFGIALMALTAGCLEDDDSGAGKICTEQFVYGLTVTVSHSETGAPVADAVVTATEGAGGASETFESGLEAGSYMGLGEKIGAFEVTVRKDGFAPQVFDVDLESDGCHVIPQSRAVVLAPGG